MGITNIFSISWGIAKVMYQFGAELAFVYKRKKLKNRIKDFAKKLNSNIVLQCNINSDAEIKILSRKLRQHWKKFDGIIHAVACVPVSQLQENYIQIANRQDFLFTHESCSFSLVALVKEFYPLLNQYASIVTLSYLGSIKYVPCYNVIGPAKASLEANVRYLAYCVGKNNIRINAVSSGPIKTASSYKIPSFKKIFSIYKKCSPLKKSTTSKEIGNVTSFLCSDLASGITGQIIYVDSGFSISNMFPS